MSRTIPTSKGRNRETTQHISGDNIIVKYDYDAVGQLTTVQHPNDKTTTYEYDLLEHKLKVNHPDAGEVTCTYCQNSQRPYTVSQVRTSKALKRKKTRNS